MSLDKKQAEVKTGQEQLTFNGRSLNFYLLDFWQWSVSDILSNATRGIFAEFLVATATNIDRTTLRDEWGAYDLVTPEGIKIEVKSSAYLQSWHQKALSKITFSTRHSFYVDPITQMQIGEKKRHADVYVFCLLHHQDKTTVNPLDLNQWEFYVVATKELNDYPRSQHSITINSLKNLTSVVLYDNLYNVIKEKHKFNLL